MPKLNVQQNNQNVIQAFRNALAIGRLKGIIASDGNHNFSTAGSNRNLLDNAYFVGGGSQLGNGIFPINQRGQTSYSTATNTTIDRWKTETSSISVDADGITWTATGDNRQFAQVIDDAQLIEGETYTASILANVVSGGARFFLGGTSSPWPTVSGSQVDIQNGLTTVTFTFSRASGYTGNYKFALASTSSGATAKIYACKLERGSISTLANDPPPDFGDELRKCQRRLFIHDFANGEIIANGFAVSASYSVCSLVLPVSMASDGTLTGTITANPLIYGGGTGEQTSSFSVSAVKGNYAKIGVATTVMPSNNAVTLYANTNIRLTISREL